VTKRCRRMKRRQRARIGFMGRKCDDVGRRRGGTVEWKGRRRRQLAGVNLTMPKNKEKSRGRFSYYK
jgi:hypothetical protein